MGVLCKAPLATRQVHPLAPAPMSACSPPGQVGTETSKGLVTLILSIVWPFTAHSKQVRYEVQHREEGSMTVCRNNGFSYASPLRCHEAGVCCRHCAHDDGCACDLCDHNHGGGWFVHARAIGVVV